MGYARKSLISLQDTPYYHVVARCVRRARLWGRDEYARRDYSHRKQWVMDRIRLLCEIFAMEVYAYAVMRPINVPDKIGIPDIHVSHNHYHLVLFVDEHRARSWSPTRPHRNHSGGSHVAWTIGLPCQNRWVSNGPHFQWTPLAG